MTILFGEWGPLLPVMLVIFAFGGILGLIDYNSKENREDRRQRRIWEAEQIAFRRMRYEQGLIEQAKRDRGLRS